MISVDDMASPAGEVPIEEAPSIVGRVLPCAGVSEIDRTNLES